MLIPNKYSGYSADGIRLYRKGADPSAAAQAQEQDRQARITAAVNTINGVFNGSPTRKGVGAASSLEQGQKYYLADGSEYVAPSVNLLGMTDDDGNAIAGGGFREKMNNAALQDPAYLRSQELFKGGSLFTGVEETPGTGGRQALYDDQKKAVYDINALDVNKQYSEAERQNRFGLARAGLAGGSADIDANAELQERTNKGLIQAAGLGDSAASDLKLADERSRQSLIGMAQSGIDTGTAQTMALNQLNATQQSAAGDRAGASVGNLFGDMSQAYLMNQIRAGQVAGKQMGASSYGVSNPRTGDSGYINK
ncbi:Hypothetical protein HEAR2270 [Herminiimonas arsenicoxydans]|uniref:Uncharacterized protein n=1 Tax=Herminiimonas arsenicoxydans TaxID=204773 RepID=A4G7B6_HERAR|nr:Hypothetical protein HEAR2270 [Herminiimonas arsenicoxydans]